MDHGNMATEVKIQDDSSEPLTGTPVFLLKSENLFQVTVGFLRFADAPMPLSAPPNLPAPEITNFLNSINESLNRNSEILEQRLNRNSEILEQRLNRNSEILEQRLDQRLEQVKQEIKQEIQQVKQALMAQNLNASTSAEQRDRDRGLFNCLLGCTVDEPSPRPPKFWRPRRLSSSKASSPLESSQPLLDPSASQSSSVRV